MFSYVQKLIHKCAGSHNNQVKGMSDLLDIQLQHGVCSTAQSLFVGTLLLRAILLSHCISWKSLTQIVIKIHFGKLDVHLY